MKRTSRRVSSTFRALVPHSPVHGCLGRCLWDSMHTVRVGSVWDLQVSALTGSGSGWFQLGRFGFVFLMLRANGR